MDLEKKINVFDAKTHFECLHGALENESREGTVFLWRRPLAHGAWKKIKPNSPNVRSFSLLNEMHGEEDCFVSVNSFSGWRKTPLLKTLNACYVDLDWGRSLRTADHEAILSYIEEAGLPAPGLVMETGRGAHVYWLLEPTPATALPIWQAIEDHLIDCLRPIKADPAVRDCTRMLRLAGSLNGKNGAYVKGVQRSNQRWSIEALAQAVLGEVPQARERKPAQGSRAQRMQGRIRGAHRWLAVLNDLIKIGRHWGRIPAGHRDQWLFLCATAISWFAAPDSIEAEVQALAQRHTNLNEADVRKAVQCAIERAKKAARGEKGFWRGMACDARYRFKRETLHRLMAPLIRHGLQDEMRAILNEDQASVRKAQRDAARWAGAYSKAGFRKEHLEHVERAGQLRAQGWRLADIAQSLEVSCSTIKRWLTNTASRTMLPSSPERARVIALPASADAKRIDVHAFPWMVALLAARSTTAPCIPAPRGGKAARFVLEGHVSQAEEASAPCLDGPGRHRTTSRTKNASVSAACSIKIPFALPDVVQVDVPFFAQNETPFLARRTDVSGLRS